jgi:serine/threonine protein phosphatase PrpC
LDNVKILDKIWSYKNYNNEDIHTICGKIANAIIKYSMKKKSADNVTVTFIAFENFEKKIRDPNFVYKSSNKCSLLLESCDFSRM